MQLIYIHGLDSGPESTKGLLLEAYAQQHHPVVRVQRPDLNRAPEDVIALLEDMIAEDPHTALVGSSLGGFFTTALVARQQVKAVLINPSVRPFDSLTRFMEASPAAKPDDVIYTTSGGWGIRPRDFDVLKSYFHATPKYPENLLVLLKTGDEVLNYREALAHYTQEGFEASVIVEPGGDHFMHDLDTKLALIFEFLFGLAPADKPVNT